MTLRRDRSSGLLVRQMSGLNSLDSLKDAMESADDDISTRSEFNRVLAFGMWDQADIVFSNKGKQSSSGKLLHQFLTKVQSIEERYAKELHNLSSTWPVSRFTEGAALFSAFANYVNMTKERAEMHGKQAELLKRLTLNKTLVTSDSIMIDPIKHFQSDLKKSAKNLKRHLDMLQDAVKSRNKFQENVIKKLKPDQVANWREHVTGKKLDKLKQLDKNVRETEIAHAMVREMHYQTIGKSLDSTQALEYRRVSILLHSMWSSIDQMSKMTSKLWKKCNQCIRQLKHVDANTDLKKFVEKYSSNKPCPFAPDNNNNNNNNNLSSTASSTSVRASVGSAAIPNPFSRRSQLTLRHSRYSEHHERRQTQDQAKKDAAKFVELLKKRQKKQNQLKIRAQRSRNQALREEQKLQIAAQADIERRIKEVTQQKDQEIAGQQELLKQLQDEKLAAEKERETLRQLLIEKEEEMKTKGVGVINENNKEYDHNDDDLELELKRPIIIDNGHGYCKIGFSGQRTPTLIIPNVVAHLSGNEKFNKDISLFGATAQHLGAFDIKNIRVNNMVFQDQPTNWEDVEELWQYMFDELGVNPSEHPILLTQPTLAPLNLKKQMVEIFYEKFEAPALYVATAPVLSAYAYGSTTGLVVDIGHSSAQVVPIVDGYLLAPHVQRAKHLGGKQDTIRVASYLQSELIKRTQDRLSPVDAPIKSLVTASTIKDRLASCSYSESDYMNLMDVLETVEDSIIEEYDDSQAMPLKLQKEMIKCGEMMFRPKYLLNDHDESIVSIPQMIEDVVSKCDVDTRKNLLSNLFLSGGVPTMPGFTERLENELLTLMPHTNPYLAIQDSESLHASWVGGSVLSGLVEFQESWVFLEEYEDSKEEALLNQEPTLTLDDMKKENLLAKEE